MGQCINPKCSKEYKPLRKGRCARCDACLRRTHSEWGDDTPPACPEMTCKCGQRKDRRSLVCYACLQSSRTLVDKTEKHCNGCDKMLPVEDFNRRADRPRSRCKDCECKTAKEYAILYHNRVKERKRKYEKNNPCKVREWGFRSSWKAMGFDPSSIQSIYLNKPASCEICGKETNVFLDHCHKTLALRGWLCGHCNKAIGLFMDDPVACRNAAAYLSKQS